MVIFLKVILKKKIEIPKTLKEIIETIIGSLIMAIGTSLLLLPNQLSSGGLAGVATIFYYLIDLPMGTTILAFNIPLFILAVYKIGKEFFIISVIGTIRFSIFVDILDTLTPLTHDRFLACIYGGVIIGLGTILKKLGITEKEKIASILAHSTNIKYVIVDTIDNIKTLSYEVWFKGNASLSEGIWLGNGIANQFTLKVTTNSRILRTELDQNFGYVIKKGKAILVKFVSEE